MKNEKKNGSRLYIVLISIIVALGGFLLGFDSSVISGATPFYKTYFELDSGSWFLGLSVSSIIAGAVLGNIIAGPLADKFGRKPILIFTAFLFTFCAIGCALAYGIYFFLIARIIGGVGVGMAILIAPMYIAETSPKKLRGLLVTFNQLNIVLGISIAYFSNYFILKNIGDPNLNWRIMLGIGAVPALVYFILLIFVPESPRWLMRKKDEDTAYKILAKIGGIDHAKAEIDEIKISLQSAVNKEKETLSTLFSKKMKWVLLIGLGIAFFQPVSGINAILYYAPMIFEMAGGEKNSAFMQAAILGVTNVIMTLIAMGLIDRLGRKMLWIIGAASLTIALTITSVSFYNATYSLSEHALTNISNDIAENKIVNGNAHLIMVSLQELKNKTFEDEVSFCNSIKAKIGIRNYSVLKEKIIKSSIHINSIMVLIGLILFVASFAISLGPVMWVLLSEIFPNKIRGLAISVTGFWCSVISFFVATLFPLELEKFGSGTTYIIFAFFGLLSLFFVLKFVPETKGKSLEELEQMLVKQENSEIIEHESK